MNAECLSTAESHNSHNSCSYFLKRCAWKLKFISCFQANQQSIYSLLFPFTYFLCAELFPWIFPNFRIYSAYISNIQIIEFCFFFEFSSHMLSVPLQQRNWISWKLENLKNEKNEKLTKNWKPAKWSEQIAQKFNNGLSNNLKC